MNHKNKTASVTIKHLLDYHKPEEVFGYCKRCPKYGQFWSCPPYDFDILEHINKFTFATIIGVRIDLVKKDTKEDTINDFFEKRQKLSIKLLELEKLHNNTEVLYGGNCSFCEVCSRPSDIPCIAPDKKRFSLESLGFKVSDITEDLLGEKLQWSKGGDLPKYLMSVFAVFSKVKIDVSSFTS